MQGKRTDRVAHLMQMELSQLVLTKIKDPRLGFVTITHVDVAPDLRSACVYFSVLGTPEAKKNSQTALERAAGFLQREVSGAIKLRNTPKLVFKLDESLEKGMEIDGILKQIKSTDDTEDGEPSESQDPSEA
ncbi:MAG TPA: 30S ribosome-binding factor RbfA [Verrucomicrobiae bacterium]|jgi:ribosome-binding factor A|nr:30S ribosome-binding factor RbfA [Verrucomicrobiae bacterium]